MSSSDSSSDNESVSSISVSSQSALGKTKDIKRAQEKTIEEVVKYVGAWRSLYNGVAIESKDEQGKPVYKLLRYRLNDAATLIENNSRKTFDDFLLQVRAGRKFNFDFVKHRDQRIGMLRQINKNYKHEENQQKGVKKRQNKKTPNVRNYLGKKKIVVNSNTESLLGVRKT